MEEISNKLLLFPKRPTKLKDMMLKKIHGTIRAGYCVVSPSTSIADPPNINSL